MHAETQIIGDEVPNWQPAPLPKHVVMSGQYCQVLPLDTAIHAADLYKANAQDKNSQMWTYLPYGPFETFETYQAWMQNFCVHQAPLFFVISNNQQVLGLASYLGIDTKNGVIEIGHIAFSPALQRTTAATEALYLMIAHAFDLGYRRVEWKCNALNGPSRTAALRLGFSFEGVFRQTGIVKGRNRDTAWYSIVDKEWPILKNAFNQWLDPLNFDGNGIQKMSLSQLTAASHQHLTTM
jgi:RimJ/RimL family protein N-acetyltransferase